MSCFKVKFFIVALPYCAILSFFLHSGSNCFYEIHIQLRQFKEFRSIKNEVIKEAKAMFSEPNNNEKKTNNYIVLTKYQQLRYLAYLRE